MSGLIDQGYPVFLTGDFNEPSSLDYTKETVGTRKGIDEPVPWPVSEELLGIGLRDTYREEHPDPVGTPGSPIRAPGSGSTTSTPAGGSKTLASKIVGEPGGGDVIEAARRGRRTTARCCRASRRRRWRCRP